MVIEVLSKAKSEDPNEQKLILFQRLTVLLLDWRFWFDSVGVTLLNIDSGFDNLTMTTQFSQTCEGTFKIFLIPYQNHKI